ncbi:MAG: efflux RND transporter permease subunit [Bacteroidales bacterium]
MIDKLIRRPIAVTMSVIAILILGFVALGMLPVSLMPNVDIPQITVQLNLNGANAREIDATVIKPLRNQLIQISTIKELRCEADNGSGIIFMQFEHGSNLDFNFIEVNEKIDRALVNLPKELERPKIIKASATDIPVFFIDITADNKSVESFIELSRFAKEVISKRIEQIEQVALVDISGVQGSQILIEPDNEKIRALGITISDLENAIKNNNISLGNLTIKDGYYQWSVRFDSEIKSREDIESIHLNIHERIYLFKDLASLTVLPGQTDGMVRSDDKRAVTFAVIKQSDAKMSDLKDNLDKLMQDFKKEYPNVTFTVSRNQTELLDYSIRNLQSNIVIGALLAVLVIFFFLKDFRSPILVTITIPLSLIISLLCLYLLGVTINIISLSGLILGIGMMVDNSIIVIDNITQHWERGDSLHNAVVKGTNQVIAPMLSSVLTTCAVFIPLIFLSGIAGSLFYDQAMGVTVGLMSSFFVAVTVIPVYYKLLYVNKSAHDENKYLQRLQMIDYVSVYEKGLKWVFRRQKLAWCVFLLMIPLMYLIYLVIDKSKLPPLTHDDVVLNIDWNTPVDILENDRRTCELLEVVKEDVAASNTLIGKQDFLLSHTGDIDKGGAMIYVKAKDADKLPAVQEKLEEVIRERYPKATFTFSQSANIFNLIFSENEPSLVAMIKGHDGVAPQPDMLNHILGRIKEALPQLYIEPVLWQEQILFVVNQELMTLYKLNYSMIYTALSRATKENTLFSIKSGTFSIPIVFGDKDGDAENLLALQVKNSDGIAIPLSLVVSERRVRDLKTIVSGKDGDYYPLNLMIPDKDIPATVKAIDKLAKEGGDFNVSFAGAYFAGREMMQELVMVLIVSLLLLFFILAAQFESLVQPLIILSEIVVDLCGAFFALWICGSGINLMSLIGIVVMCGIVINDSILKVDTINHLRKDGYSLLRAIMLAGSRRLKPILMTSLTTILAIAPFLVRGDMGSDLQFPLSVALIGGMILGTAVSIFFIPVFYYEIYRRSGK